MGEIGKAAALPIINGPPDVHEVAKRAVHKLRRSPPPASSNGDKPLVKLRKPIVIILDQFEEYFAYPTATSRSSSTRSFATSRLTHN